MTEIESTLLDELERLEKERKQEIGILESRLRVISEEYKTNAEMLRTNYQNSLAGLMKQETKEDSKLITLLTSLSNQQQRIIELLQQPVRSDNLADKLNEVLKGFFDTLEKNLITSNGLLTEEIKSLLKPSN